MKTKKCEKFIPLKKFRCFGIPLGQIGCRLVPQPDLPSIDYFPLNVFNYKVFGSEFKCTEWRPVQLENITPISETSTLGKH